MTIRGWHIALFVAALILFGIALAPASLFAPQTPGGFSYARAEGTIWRARFLETQLGPLRAEAMTWRLSLLDLIQGRFIADVSFEGDELSGQARLLANLDGDRRLMIPNLRASRLAVGEETLSTESTLTGVDVFFIGGTCETASGAAATDVLARNEAALRWRGPALTGSPACAGQTADIAVAQSGAAAPGLRMTAALRGDGTAVWRVELPADMQAATLALAQLGAAPSPQSGGFVAEGEWRWFPF